MHPHPETPFEPCVDDLGSDATGESFHTPTSSAAEDVIPDGRWNWWSEAE